MVVASPVTEARSHDRRFGVINMVFLLAASVRSVSWLCDSKRSYFGSTRPGMALAVLLLVSPVLSGCLGEDDWGESEWRASDYRVHYEDEDYICYDGIAILDCNAFPEGYEKASSESYWFDHMTNGDSLYLILSSYEDSSGTAIVTVTTQDGSDSFKLSDGELESRIFPMRGYDPYLEVVLEADNGWFGDIVHYTIELQIDTTHRDTDLDGYIDTVDFCDYTYGTSSVVHLGCTDSDGDGWSNADEYACGTYLLLENHTPLDSDNDAVCNYLDEDDDGDGWDDTEELSCGADPLSPNSIPVMTGTDECHAILLGEGGFWESHKDLIAAMAIIGTLAAVLRQPNPGKGPPRRREGTANGAIDYQGQGLENFTVAELKGLLREWGLPVGGRKAELISRLLDNESEEFGWQDDVENDPGPVSSKSDPALDGMIGVFRRDVNHAVWVNAPNGQTIGDAVASSGLIGRDGAAWSITDRSGRYIDKREQASNFWSQSVMVVFQWE